MKPDSPDDLTGLVDRALKRLPPPRAPRTLLPRVMAAVEALETLDANAPRPQPGRTWFMWPRAWQAASIAALLVLVWGMVWIWPSPASVATLTSSTRVAGVWMRAVDFLQGASAIVSVVSIVWEAFLEPIVRFLFVWIVLMCAACAGFGAALGRVALGGASHP